MVDAILLALEAAGAFEDDVDRGVVPVDLGDVGNLGNQNALPIDHHGVLFELDAPVEIAVDRVVLEQVGQFFIRGHVVDFDHLKLGVALSQAEDGATDATKAVDADA